MKTILIATDYSEASRNAVLYGLGFAKAIGAKALLFHAYEVPLLAPDAIIVESLGKMETIAAEQMESEKEWIIGKVAFDFDTSCEQGEPAQAVMNKAKEVQAGMIVAGIKGKGKAVRKVFGSIATALANHSDIPVLLVPEEAVFAPLESIVFANDVTIDTDIHVLDDLKTIAETFKSRLFVVKVVKNKTEEWHEVLNTPETLLMAVRKLDAEFDYPVNRDIVQALNDFAGEHHARLIAMMPHKHFWTDLFLGRSHTKDMIFHAKVPLLILPEKHYSDLFREMKKHHHISEGLVM